MGTIKNKSFCSLIVHKIIRTNNSLENFNINFKHSYHMEGHMNLIKYIDNLLECTKDQIDFYKIQLILKQNKHINSQININTESDEENSDKILIK